MIDPAWEKVYAAGWGGEYPPEHVIRFMARHFYSAPDRTKVRVLDLGCGKGATLWYLVREDFAAAGIDGSPTAIAEAKETIDADHPGMARVADLRVGDLRELPWPDGRFDCVLDVCAVTHNPLPDCRAIVVEVHRVLKPGGLLFSCLFAPTRFAPPDRDKLDAAVPPTTFFYPDIRELFATFEVVEVNRSEWTTQGGERAVGMWLVEVKKR